MNNEITTKKVFLRTFGCQMNEYDSEIIRSILAQAGYAFVDAPEQADVIVMNTCAVRENAHRKVVGHIHALRHALKGRDFVLGILGCMATNLKDGLLDDPALGIDFVAGPDSYRRMPDLIARARIGKEKALDVDLSEYENYAGIEPSRVSRVNAWVAIMRGCNNFCTFCVVPYTRGRERSRPLADIIRETEKLVTEGYKQVSLLGQNVNSYRDDDTDFADLLKAVSRVEGIERIRFMSPHPKDFMDRVIRIVADNPKVCPHVHLPLQAGNSRVLQMMNRTYTQEDYLSLAAKIKSGCPGVALTTDIIVGFPTETDEEFEDTVRVMETVAFDSAFIFKYSPRKGTVASRKYPDDVPDEVKTRRIVRLNALQKEISLHRNRTHVGQIEPVMIEDLRTSRSDQEIQGRTPGNTLVVLPAVDCRPGDVVPVRILDATPHVLKGQAVMVPDSPHPRP